MQFKGSGITANVPFKRVRRLMVRLRLLKPTMYEIYNGDE